MKKQMSFEQSLKRLEEIVSEMENEMPDLDKALALFKEGVNLVDFCSQKLNETKKEIEILSKEGGAMSKKEWKQ